MMWKLVSDSSSDLPSIPIGGLPYEAVPLTLRVGQREFLDDDTLSIPELLAAMASEQGPSSTACPSPEAFAQAFRAADKVICVTISQNLSGTYNAACLGKALVQEETPEKDIAIIDSFSTSGEMALILRRAAELIAADPNRDFAALEAQLNDYRDSLCTIFTLECFDNLVKNGRMKPLVGTLLQTLGIHVVADASPEGTIRVRDKARGEKKTFQTIVKQMAAAKDPADAHVIISHCANPGGAERLKAAVVSALPVHSVEIMETRGLCSFYAMDQGLILGF